MQNQERIDVSQKLDEIEKLLIDELEFYYNRSRRDFTPKDYAEQTAIELVIDQIKIIKGTLERST